MTQLLEYMDVPRQSFYNTFGSKEEILFESIQLYSDGIRQLFREVLAGAQTPFEKIDRLFAMWEEKSLQGDGAGCFFGNCVVEFGKTHDKVAAMMAEKLESFRDIFEGIFQEAIDRGDLPEDRSADVMASAMVTYAQGLALISKTTTGQNHIHSTVEIMKRSLKQ